MSLGNPLADRQTDRQTDRYNWKHYLPQTTYTGGEYEIYETYSRVAKRGTVSVTSIVWFLVKNICEVYWTFFLQMARGGRSTYAPAIERLGIKPYPWGTECFERRRPSGTRFCVPAGFGIISNIQVSSNSSDYIWLLKKFQGKKLEPCCRQLKYCCVSYKTLN